MKPAVKPIRLGDVGVAYHRDPVLHGVSGTFDPGSMTAVVGSNGAGKTTLLKALMGEIPLARGTIDRAGLSARDFGYLPQATEIDRSFPMSVADTIMLGAWREAGPFRAFNRDAAERGRMALAAVGLEGLETRQIGSLSGGQFQRVLFARLLLQDTRVILLDEPFSAVDTHTRRDLLAIIGRWRDEQRTVLVALHDLDLVRQQFPQTLLLAGGEAIAWGATAEALTDANLLRAQALTEHMAHHSHSHSHEHAHSHPTRRERSAA